MSSVGQCCVKLVNGWTVLYSSILMVGQCWVQLSNGWSLLCHTVQWSYSAVSYSPVISYLLKQEVLTYNILAKCLEIYALLLDSWGLKILGEFFSVNLYVFLVIFVSNHLHYSKIISTLEDKRRSFVWRIKPNNVR